MDMKLKMFLTSFIGERCTIGGVICSLINFFESFVGKIGHDV